MRGERQSQPARNPAPLHGALAKGRLAGGDGWSVHEVVCRAGPSDRPFEERHDGFSVSAVLDGTFTYRSGAGHGLLYPGSLLLGNHGQCFECGHAHGLGDRCVSLNVREDLFGEIAAAAGSSRFRFAAPSLPTPEALPIVASLEALSAFGSAPGRDETALTLAERVIALTAGERQSTAAPTGRETKRVVEAIRLIESEAARPLELKEMAASAGMSKYHFLRVFRRLTGSTPHQYLINARLRRAARALSSSRRPVIAVALEAGFGDLSTFNKTFRAAFGLTPTQYRRGR